MNSLENEDSYILNSSKDDTTTSNKSTKLGREWGLLAESELCGELSLEDHTIELPFPDGASSSNTLNENMILQMVEILPSRIQGYSWIPIYCSHKNGFHISTLYRKMLEFGDEFSPILLIIKDSHGDVFGAMFSGPVCPSLHFQGTGDTCFLWRFAKSLEKGCSLEKFGWSGSNYFFVYAATEYLGIGAGKGHYGLWLDAELYHGRSETCETFDNVPLCSESEDFSIESVEAFGFKL